MGWLLKVQSLAKIGTSSERTSLTTPAKVCPLSIHDHTTLFLSWQEISHFVVTYVFPHVPLLLHSITTLLPECSIHDCEDCALSQRLEYPQIPEDDEILYFGAFIKLPSGQHHVHSTWPLEVRLLYFPLVFILYPLSLSFHPEVVSCV